MGPDALAQVLQPLANLVSGTQFPNLMRGLDVPDDAAVWKLDDERALVLTADFFPPIVDDPGDFGAIAAANALSDVYAMGARPLVAINLVGFPNDLEPAILSQILEGGARTVLEAGAVIAGGHTTVDPEPKYGLAVVGEVHPDLLWTNGGAKAGDVLLLTKGLGTGILTTAAKKDRLEAAHLDAAVDSMKRLHRRTLETLRSLAVPVHAVTDITGFGLAGHAWEMAQASDVHVALSQESLPALEGVRDALHDGLFPGGLGRNREHLIRAQPELEGADLLLFDPQTSGGLFIALPRDAADAFERKMADQQEPVSRIGQVEAGPPRLSCL